MQGLNIKKININKEMKVIWKSGKCIIILGSFQFSLE